MPTGTSEAGSVSCPRTLWHTEEGNRTSDLPITRYWLYSWATVTIILHQHVHYPPCWKKNNDYRHIPLASVVIVIWVPSAVPPRSHHHATPGPNAVFLLSQLVLRKYSEHVPSPHPLVSAPLKIYARILFWSILTSAFIILAQLQEKFSKLSLKWQGLQVNHRLPVWLDSSAWNQEKIKKSKI